MAEYQIPVQQYTAMYLPIASVLKCSEMGTNQFCTNKSRKVNHTSVICFTSLFPFHDLKYFNTACNIMVRNSLSIIEHYTGEMFIIFLIFLGTNTQLKPKERVHS